MRKTAPVASAGGVDRPAVTSVVVPGTSGSMGFLKDHAPLITVLKAGEVKVKTAQGEKSFSVNGGVVEVMNDTVLVLAE